MLSTYALALYYTKLLFYPCYLYRFLSPTLLLINVTQNPLKITQLFFYSCNLPMVLELLIAFFNDIMHIIDFSCNINNMTKTKVNTNKDHSHIKSFVHSVASY